MKKIFFPILLGLGLVAVSCQDKLDIPQKGVVSADDFYSSEDDAVALRANMYASLFGGNGVAGSAGIYNCQQAILNYSADDVLAAGGDAADHGDFRVFDEFRYDNANGPLLGLYNGYATSIYAANLIISNFSTENRNGDAPKFESAKTKQYVEEARVMRAWMHMMQALIWYAPNKVDRILGADELPTQAADQKEILTWVISECEKAISSGVLPERASKTDKDGTAIMTKGFAQFIAGKAAVYADDMASARKYLGDLIASDKYDLVPSNDFWTNFHRAGDGNCEKIFGVNFLEDPNFTNNAWGSGTPIQRGRWMVADVLCWRTDAMASTPSVCEKLPSAGGGWNGGAISEAFAEKFLAHDGNSPRRKATFITEDEFLFEMDWSGSAVNDGTLAEKKADPKRGISNTAGVYSHSKYFEWKNMVYHNPPRILTGGASYPADNVDGLGANSNQTNVTIARYAEALLLYAEACLGSSDEAKGLAALKKVQERSGSGHVNGSSYTIQDVIEEKQYELWFENTRFTDVVRWSKKGYVDLNTLFNGDLHKKVPIVTDDFFTKNAAEHKLSVSYVKADYNDFVVGKHEYLPFPRDVKTANPELKDVLGWATADEEKK